MSEEPEELREARRKGRGRLSSIEMLPEEADDAIAWVNAQLRERTMPQTEILRQFNAMLADYRLGPINRGAFSRYSIRKAIELRKLEASREITNTVLGRFNLEDRSDATIALAEMIKSRILEMTLNADTPTEIDLDEVTQALNRLSTIARREHQLRMAERREAREEEVRRHAEEERQREETAATVEKIAVEAGLGADRIAAIRKGVLGLAG